MILLLIALLLGPPIPSFSETREPQQPHSPNRQQDTASDQRGSDSLPLAVEKPPAQITESKATQDAGESHEKSSSDWWLVILTGVLCCIGIVHAVVFGLQAKRLKETVIEMRSTATHQLRAYVATNRGIVRAQNPNKGTRYEFEAHFKNFGQTPALEYQVGANALIAPYNESPQFDFSIFPEVDSKTAIGAGANATTSIRLGYDLTAADLDRLKDGSYCPFVYGIVRYRDVFGTKHKTEFCMIVKWDHTENTYEWVTSRTHNENT